MNNEEITVWTAFVLNAVPELIKTSRHTSDTALEKACELGDRLIRARRERQVPDAGKNEPF